MPFLHWLFNLLYFDSLLWLYCLVMECEDPSSDIENGYIIRSSSTFGSMLAYRCHQNYVLEGDLTRYCTGSHPLYWNGTQPTCECRYYLMLNKGMCKFTSLLNMTIYRSLLNLFYKYVSQLHLPINHGYCSTELQL